MKQAHIFITGFVQGVGFRSFIKRHAQRFGINGWAINLPDHRIEAVFQSSVASDQDDHIKELIDLCHKGPMLSEVDEVVVEWEDVEEILHDFEIKH